MQKIFLKKINLSHKCLISGVPFSLSQVIICFYQVNQVIQSSCAMASNPRTLFFKISKSARVFMVLDLANAFFQVPFRPQLDYLFDFPFHGGQLSWTRLLANSPLEFSQELLNILQRWLVSDGCFILQYISICFQPQKICWVAYRDLLKFLYKARCKILPSMQQCCQDKVPFLGHCISEGCKLLISERIYAILKAFCLKNRKP